MSRLMIAATSSADVAPVESTESTEQLYHPDLGYSPKFSRCPTREQFRAAMAAWTAKAGDGWNLSDEGCVVRLTHNGNGVFSWPVRD